MLSFNLPNTWDLRADFRFDSIEASPSPLPFPPPAQTPKPRKHFWMMYNVKTLLSVFIKPFILFFMIFPFIEAFSERNWSTWSKNWDHICFSRNRSCVSNFINVARDPLMATASGWVRLTLPSKGLTRKHYSLHYPLLTSGGFVLFGYWLVLHIPLNANIR